MNVVLHHRFTTDVREVRRDGTRLTLDVPGWKALSFKVPSPTVADAIEVLGAEGASVERLMTIASAGLDPGPASQWVGYYLERFRRARLLEWVARREGEVLVTFRSLASGFALAEGDPPGQAMRLSRFAYARRDGPDLVLESPETPCRAILSAPGTEVLRRVAEGVSTAPLEDPILALFWRAGFLEPAEDLESGARASWEFHDRLFHVTSRGGRDGITLGGTYRFRGRFPAPPAIKPPMSPASIALPRPDPDTIAAGSGRLVAVMDRRRSVRAYSEAPIEIGALSEFLFRVARITEVFSGGAQDLVSRPFPSGGSIHEIEFYLAVGACRGLEPALYHYQGLDHALEPMPNTGEGAGRLLAYSARAMGAERPPQALVVLSCRLPRFAWKYEGMAYRLILMHAGVIMQTMYLVATDMGLAGCANGAGDSRLFAEITGLEPLSETSIGEFALGSVSIPTG